MSDEAGQEIGRLEVAGAESSVSLGDAELAGEAEAAPRPERVHPPSVQACNCDVGLFNQLRGRVARGEVLKGWFVEQMRERGVTAKYSFLFENGQLKTESTYWQERLPGELLKLLQALRYWGGFSVVLQEGRVAQTVLWEHFVVRNERGTVSNGEPGGEV